MTNHVFIDTNVYLKFYHFSNDDLEELNKLLVLLDEDQIELYIPQQVVDEFRRNRDTKLADALKSFKQGSDNEQFPQFCKSYEEYSEMKQLMIQYKAQKQSILTKIMSDIESNSLHADLLIEQLFEKANFIPNSEELILKAKLRYDLGNPPGKNKSYGDAINWEAIIDKVPNEQNLFFITDDKDYFSETNKSVFNHFLAKEWNRQKSSEIKFHKTLTDFFKTVYPDIQLSSELAKEILVAQLINSSNFYNARQTLKKLSRYTDYTVEQANQYVLASVENTQVLWISEDDDINEYLHEFVEKHKEKIEDNLLAHFYSLIPLIN